MDRCEAITKNGKKCKNRVLPGKNHCYIKSHSINDDSTIKKFLKKWIFTSGFLAFISLLITVFWNYYQDITLKALSYENYSISYRPKLTLVDKPIINELGLTPVIEDINSDNNDIPVIVKFTIKFKIQNTESHLAQILLTAAKDAHTGEDILRKGLLNESNAMRIIPDQRLFPSVELGYHDTTTFSVNHQINHLLDESKGILHFMILYENEVGVHYDNYYWLEYSINLSEIPMPISPNGISKKEYIKYFFRETTLNNNLVPRIIKIDDIHSTSHIYSIAEKNRVTNLIESKSLKEEDLDYNIKIKPLNTIVIQPNSNDELWEIRSQLSCSDVISIKNINAYIWIDNNFSSDSIPESAFVQHNINLSLVDTYNLSITESKSKILEIYNSSLGLGLFKHTVVVFQNLKGKYFRSELTEMLIYNDNGVVWYEIFNEKN